MKEELLGIERYQGPKERSLAQASSNLEAMQTTKDGLEAELHQVNYFLILLLIIHIYLKMLMIEISFRNYYPNCVLLINTKWIN